MKPLEATWVKPISTSHKKHPRPAAVFPLWALCRRGIHRRPAAGGLAFEKHAQARVTQWCDTCYEEEPFGWLRLGGSAAKQLCFCSDLFALEFEFETVDLLVKPPRRRGVTIQRKSYMYIVNIQSRVKRLH